MLYFTQPSSRTFLSFENACHILGIKTSEIRDPNVSSEVKGESFDDSPDNADAVLGEGSWIYISTPAPGPLAAFGLGGLIATKRRR